jgi:hypothetical protein
MYIASSFSETLGDKVLKVTATNTMALNTHTSNALIHRLALVSPIVTL